MPPVVSARAQTQHPCGQIKPEPNRDGCVALYFLIYSTVSVTTQAKRGNAHRDMNSRRDWGLRWLVRLLRLIGCEGSRNGLPMERDTRRLLPLRLCAFVRCEKHLY